jgi:23S rRNA G2445 N2-methylase RlmL
MCICAGTNAKETPDKVIDINAAKSADQTIYDPTCGSGSLLIKAHDHCQIADAFNRASVSLGTVPLSSAPTRGAPA